MDNQINQILQELYEIDGNFRQHEEKLKKIITQLLKARPDAKLDKEFVEQLRRQLMAKASLMQKETTNNFSFMKRLNYILSGALVVAVLAIAGVYYNQQKPGVLTDESSGQQLLAANVEINKMSERAFGKLNSADLAPAGMGGSGIGMGGGGGAADRNFAAASPSESGGSADAKIMPPYQTYTYKYKGGDINLDQDQLAVYRRIRGMGNNVSAAGLLKQLNFGLVDVSKFTNTKVQSLNIVEDKEFGYNFYISLEEGVINISQNWLKWPNPERDCKDQQCYENLRFKLGDVPSDEELINITNQFLKDHNISLASYGQPEVQNTWKREYENFVDKSQFYIPGIITVVYPLKIQGQEVYDQGGGKSGMYVSVDIRHKKVSGVGDLVNLKYDSSMYPAVTDMQAIIKYAEKGGTGYPYYGENLKTTELELGQPTQAYVKLWKSDGGTGQEILVPALIFSITNTPNNYYHKNIVVPLIKDFMEERNDDPVRIMPAQ